MKAVRGTESQPVLMNGDKAGRADCSLIRYLEGISSSDACDDTARHASVLLFYLGYFDRERTCVDTGSLRGLLGDLQSEPCAGFLSTITSQCQGCSQRGDCLAGIAIRDF